MLIVRSITQDVYRNLAMEEYLMEYAGDNVGPILFLWQSSCAVVMGKNQNPWRECRLDLMRDEGVPLARRISGGGTVYHDAGNLNYCIIVDRPAYREEQAFLLIIEALCSFGISAEKSGKSNLCVDGRKVSGNAFAFRKGKVMHHGTLLVQSDLTRLNRYLGSMFDAVETRAVRSIPATVCNLADYSAGLTIGELVVCLELLFCRNYGGGEVFRWGTDGFFGSVLDLMDVRQRSNAWIFESTPGFKVLHHGIALEVVRGMVTSVSGTAESDMIGRSFFELAFSL